MPLWTEPMGQVSITLNNRTYRLACEDGEEARLSELARDVKARVERLSREFGHAADDRLLLMAAVLIADELMDLREEHRALRDAHDAVLTAAAEVLRETAAEAGVAVAAEAAAAGWSGGLDETIPAGAPASKLQSGGRR